MPMPRPSWRRPHGRCRHCVESTRCPGQPRGVCRRGPAAAGGL